MLCRINTHAESQPTPRPHPLIIPHPNNRSHLLWIIPSSLYSHYYFTNASGLLKTIGFFSIAAHYYFIWMKFRNLDTGAGDKFTSNALLIGWFALNLFLLSGFNFDLPR